MPSRTILKWQSLFRILVIPWFILMIAASLKVQKEEIGYLYWIDWVSLKKPIRHEAIVHLIKDEKYRLVVMVHAKDLLDHSVIAVTGTVYSTENELVYKNRFSGVGTVLTGDLARMALSIHADELVDNRDVDRTGKTRRLVSSPVFSVNSTENYLVAIDVESVPSVWEIAMLINTQASISPRVTAAVILLYFPIFLFLELYFLFKKITLNNNT